MCTYLISISSASYSVGDGACKTACGAWGSLLSDHWALASCIMHALLANKAKLAGIIAYLGHTQTYTNQAAGRHCGDMHASTFPSLIKRWQKLAQSSEAPERERVERECKSTIEREREDCFRGAQPWLCRLYASLKKITHFVSLCNTSFANFVSLNH